MTATTAAVEVFTPRPRTDQPPLCEQLLTSISSTDSDLTDSMERLPTPASQRNRQRNHVQFADTKPSTTSRPTAERIKVDEIDDNLTPVLDENPSRSARSRSRSRSVLRNAVGPRSASRPGRRRALSRGRPISRDTTCDQSDAPALTAEQIARELRPESFTRFKRISPETDKQTTSSDRIDYANSADFRGVNFENEAKAMRNKLENNHSLASLSPGEETHSNTPNNVQLQVMKLPNTEKLDPNNSPREEEEHK